MIQVKNACYATRVGRRHGDVNTSDHRWPKNQLWWLICFFSLKIVAQLLTIGHQPMKT